MSKKSNTKRPIFTRGYKECREKINNSAHFTMSCFNCAYYYQAKGDSDEVCQNTSVLKYDMVVEKNRVYCLKWKLSSSKTEQQTMFKKSRAKLE